MLDSRIDQLANVLCDHSLKLNSDDHLLIHAFDVPADSLAQIVAAAQKRKAKVVARIEQSPVRRQLMLGHDEASIKLTADLELYEMKHMTAYMALRGNPNVYEESDVPGETKKLWQQFYAEPVVFGQRVPHTKWVALKWPLASMAQQASMSTAAFEEFYFRVCTMDYAKMAVAAKPLADLMNRTDQVHITGPGTDLRFSIKDIGAVPCTGEANIPDGECFSCPVRNSANGVIQFNTTSLYMGQDFSDIRYEVKNGKIVDASAGAMTTKLNEILDTDEGSRYFGEWALGFNPYVLHPMKDTLFDEKIAGSFHLTPGNAYPPPGGNGNKSAIHWDTVLIQRPEYGGGEIWFDGVLIRKDGLFVLPELQGLNPDQLK